MSTRIKIASTPAELDAVFRVRHRVFVDEEGLLPATKDGRLCDRFDAFPTTANLIALVDGEVVGSVRFMDGSGARTSAEDYFDFRPHVPTGGRAGCMSQLVVARRARRVPGLSFSMMAMGYHWCRLRGLTHVTAAANPAVLPMFEGVGWHAICPEYFDERHGVPVVPVLLDMRDLNDRFRAFLTRHEAQVLDACDREFYAAGETIFRAGEPGARVYLVISGTINVHAGPPLGDPLAVIGPKALLGERAARSDGRRTATAIAETDVELMVVDEAVFEARTRTRGERVSFAWDVGRRERVAARATPRDTSRRGER